MEKYQDHNALSHASTSKGYAINTFKTGIVAAMMAVAGGNTAFADQVILDDLIVDGSVCIGQDCVNGESFGFDTIRLKENNLRIKFQDTSNTASFPSNDWQITINDTANGGANKFSIDDIDGGRTPFTIEAGAPSHSLYVEDGGHVGLGTSTPVVDLHTVSGNTPTLRLEQDGSSGFTPQTWDLAGNEANFFIRDVTNGSRLPFRIKPSAPSDSIFIDSDGDVGMGTSSPETPLHVRRTDGNASILVEEVSSTSSGRTLMKLRNNGNVRLDFIDNVGTTSTDDDVRWRLRTNDDGNFIINDRNSDNTEFNLDPDGDLTIEGNFISNGTTLNVPDYVFEQTYSLMPLPQLATFIEQEKHLPNIPSAAEIKEDGVNITEMQMKLLEKVEELTLYTLEQEKTIKELRTRLAALETEAAADTQHRSER